METAEREAVAQPAGPAAAHASSAAPAGGGSTGFGGVDTYESTRLATASPLGTTVGVQRHKKFNPLYVAQIQAPSVKDPSKVQTQWLPKYRQKEHAALAYDIANTWRLLRGVAGVTDQKARFNFPQADYLGDKALCALLEPCNSFREVKRLIKALLPPSARPEQSPRSDAGKGQDGSSRRTKMARSGVIAIELTTARLRDCRVYLQIDALERAFPEAAAALAAEQASEIGWADLHIHATAAKPQIGADQVFELTFGVLGRDGLPVRASSLRPLFDLLGAQAGDVLHLQYTGYKDRAVQVRASLAARPGAKAAAAAGGGSMLQSGRQQAGAAASGAELEAAADLLGMWQGQAEGLLPADGTRAGTPSLSASPPGSFGHRKRTQAEDFSSGSSGSSEQPVAKRRVLECGGSNAGFAAPGLQPLQAHQGQPPPLQQPESGPEPQQQQQQQQPQEEGSIARAQQALGSHFGHRRDGGCREQHAVPAQLEEHTPQPAPTAPGTNPAGSHGTASAAPGTADSVQQASALLAAALRADERRRPGQQVRAVMETLRLMGVERTLRKEYANLYAKLSIMQQELQVLFLEGLLRESDAAAEVEAHLHDELAQQRQQQQQQQEQQQPVGSSQAVHA
ncbi:hypothetical protein ABPG77_011445 [Micractinium sp. CCAP 211/92]